MPLFPKILRPGRLWKEIRYYNNTQCRCVCVGVCVFVCPSILSEMVARSHASEIWWIGVTWSEIEHIHVCLVIWGQVQA